MPNPNPNPNPNPIPNPNPNPHPILSPSPHQVLDKFRPASHDTLVHTLSPFWTPPNSTAAAEEAGAEAEAGEEAEAGRVSYALGDFRETLPVILRSYCP